MNTNIDMLNKIKLYDKIVIFGHTSPDGDCYGSQSGLRAFLREIFPNKEIYMVGSGFAKAIPYLDAMDVVNDDFIKDSLAIVVDVSDLERIEDQRIVTAREIIKFDHHLNSDREGFASVNVSNTNASSCAQMIGEFILDNSYQISKEVGERIFTGIITDSGRFLYLNSSKRLFEVCNEIMKANIDYQKIYDFLYEIDEVSNRAKGYISYNFKTTSNGVAYIVLTKEILHELKIDYNYASTMVNCLSSMKGYPVWASFAESDSGEVRVELRSKKYNVQQVALQFGGGGHLNASGCKLMDINDYSKVVDVLNTLSKE